MPTYDIPQREEFFAPSSAFGATTESQRWIGPPGKVGWVRDMRLYLTADCVGTSTVPELAVGTSQGDASYARWRLGTAVGTGYTSAQGPRRARQDSGGLAVYEDFTGHVKMETARIPKDTGFYISRVAGTGGVPAGTGISYVTIEWF